MAEEKERLTADASVKHDGGHVDGRAGESSGTDREHLGTTECQSQGGNKPQALLEKHDVEVNSNSAEVSEALKKTSQESSDAGKDSSKHRAYGSQAEGRDFQQRRRNNAFSVLLVRANTSVPTTRVDLESGSWREAIGELVGCPDDRELATVRNNHERGTE